MLTALPRVSFLLPDGSTCWADAEAIIGRGRCAQVRIDDARVSTVHAEISWRDGGFHVLARGGRVQIDGVAVAEGRLAEGTRITLVPGLCLEVVAVQHGEAPPVPRTAGRDALRFVERGPDRVDVHRGHALQPTASIEGASARLFAILARRVDPLPWDVAAAELWPDDGALRCQRGALRTEGWTAIDERRFRNRFDQVLASLRRSFSLVRDRPMLELRQGRIRLCLELNDRLETEPTEAPR